MEQADRTNDGGSELGGPPQPGEPATPGQEAADPGPQPSAMPSGTRLAPGSLCNGRYLGENGRQWLDLRFDASVAAAVSVDLHTVGGDEELSGISDSRNFDPDAGAWRMHWRRGSAGESPGWLAIRPVPEVPGRIDVQLYAEAASTDDGLRAEVLTGATLDRTSDLLRTLGLEMEVERGVQPPLAVVDRGVPMDIGIALRRAGIDVRAAGVTTEIDPPEGGIWQGADVLGALNRAMERGAQTSLGAPAFEARLLWLSRSDRKGLCGVMFDIEDRLPRQGAAVFVDEIRDRFPAATADAQILRYAVHEIGHVLALTHTFSVGAWDSLSFMNYDWYYLGGGSDELYRQRFDWSFAAEELRFLRHAFRPDIIPGGAPFGSDEYWLHAAEEGDATDATAARGLRLWLSSSDSPSATEPVTLGHGEPVFLGISLANVGDRSFVVPQHVLDLKARHLSLLIERDGGPETQFSPFMRRCYDAGTLASPAPWLLRLAPGHSLHENLTLTFGGNGRGLADPGTYTVTPVIDLPPAPGTHRGLRVRGLSRTVVVTPDAPVGAAQLLENDAALAVALGSSLELPDMGDALDHVRSMTSGPDGAGTDRVQAVLDRIDGLTARRQRDNAQAARLLDRALERAGGIFDPQTREQTRRLARQCAAEAGREEVDRGRRTSFAVSLPAPGPAPDPVGSAPAPDVVVELTWPDGAGGNTRARAAGVLRVDRAGQGWSVLSPVGHLLLPIADGGEIRAVLVVASADGTTERLPAARIDLMGAPDAAPVLAMFWLPRPIRGEPSPCLDTTGVTIGADGTGLWPLLAAQGLAPAGLEKLMPADIAAWEDGAHTALQQLAVTDPAAGDRLGGRPPPVPVRVHSAITLADVGGWICRLTNICGDASGDWAGPDGQPMRQQVIGLPYPYDPKEPFVTEVPVEGSERPEEPPGTQSVSATGA